MYDWKPLKKSAWLVTGFLIVGTLSALQQPYGKDKEARRAMIREIDVATAQLTEFEKTKDVTHLDNATKAMERIDVIGLSDARKREIRHRTAALWHRTLAAIDRNLDHKFNPNDAHEQRIP